MPRKDERRPSGEPLAHGTKTVTPALSLSPRGTTTSFNLADEQSYTLHRTVQPRMRRRTFDADLHECRLETPSHHRVVGLPPVRWQLYNGHCYPLDGSYGCRDRLRLPSRKVVHSC